MRNAAVELNDCETHRTEKNNHASCCVAVILFEKIGIHNSQPPNTILAAPKHFASLLPTRVARRSTSAMNTALSYLQCKRTFEQKVRQFHAEAYLPKLKELHIETIGSMATSCSWNPERTTDALVKERILKPIFAWNGEGPEPERSSMIKQLMWNCVQEQLQDTRNRFDPRLRDIAPTMGLYNRRDCREAFRTEMRPTVPEIDDEP